MKYFIVLALLCAVVSIRALTDEQKGKVKTYSADCIAQSGVDKNLVDKGRQGDFADDPKLKAFISCFLKKSGIQNEAGEIQASVIKQKLANDFTEDEIDAVLAKCNKGGATPEDTAADFYKCYWGTSSKHVELV